MKKPLISVVIPARNEFPAITFTIQSIINDLETFLEPSEFEIIICANCCDDWYNVERDRRACGGTVDYLMPRGIYWNRVLRILYDPIAGNHSTRNKGALLARGKYLFFSDGHMSYKRGYFQRMIRAIDETKGLVHGTIGWLGAYPPSVSMGYQYTIKLGEEIKGCVDEKTEILTKDGWKKWNEVDMETEFATWNRKLDIVEFQKPRELVIKDWDDKMVEIKGRSYDALLTPHHRCLTEDRIVSAGLLSGKEKLPLGTGGLEGGKIKKYPDELVELIGWIITEGSFDKDTIIVTQYIEKNRKIIENLLKKLKLSYCIKGKKKRDFKIHQNDTKRIREILPKKELTFKFVNQCTKSQLKKLYRVLMDADGTKTKTNESFVQVNKTTINAFQYLCVLIGRASKWYTKPPWKNHYGKQDIQVVSVKKNPYHTDWKINNNVRYKGKVWCPDLENGTIFARRNGYVYPTGNTWNNYKLADDYFYIPLQGHCCLGVLREQFLEFDGYPKYTRCYGGGEFYIDMKWWMFGKTVVVDSQAIGYHLCAPRGYSYNHDDYVHNILAIGLALGMEDWVERAYINWCRKGRKEVMERILKEAREASKEDTKYINEKKVKTVNEILVERPWDKLNDKRYGKHNSAMLIFQDTILPLFKGTPAEELYNKSKFQEGLAKFIDEKLADKVYKRGYKEPSVLDARVIQHKKI